MASKKQNITGFPGHNPERTAELVNTLNQQFKTNQKLIFKVNADGLSEKLGILEGELAGLVAGLESKIIGETRAILLEVFAEAINKGFGPKIANAGYFDHIMGAVANLPIIVYRDPSGLKLAVRVSYSQLGTWGDIVGGMHEGAIIAQDYSKARTKDVFNDEGKFLFTEKFQARIGDMKRVKLPYKGDDLKYPVDRRYRFWLAVYTGQPYQPTSTKKYRNRAAGSPVGPEINTEGMLEATIAARVETWKNKAPEWLYLQYGQMVSEPKVRPQNIVEKVEQKVEEMLYQLMRNEFSQAITDSNTYANRVETSESAINPAVLAAVSKYGFTPTNLAEFNRKYEAALKQGQDIAIGRAGYNRLAIVNAKSRRYV